MFGSYEKIKKKGLDIEAILKNYSKQKSGKEKKKSNFKLEDGKADEDDSPIVEAEEIAPTVMTREKTVAKQV